MPVLSGTSSSALPGPQQLRMTEQQFASRAKFGEAAFLDVYQKLYEAPDPAPILSGAMVRGHAVPRYLSCAEPSVTLN